MSVPLHSAGIHCSCNIFTEPGSDQVQTNKPTDRVPKKQPLHTYQPVHVSEVGVSLLSPPPVAYSPDGIM